MLAVASTKVARAENKRGHRPSFKIVRRLVRSAAATFEIRSNLFENVHQKGNRRSGRSSAGCARLRRQRGAPTRRASEKVGSNNPDEIGTKKKKAKMLKNFTNK